MSDTREELEAGSLRPGDEVTTEGVVDHPDGTVDVPEAKHLPSSAHPGTTRTWLSGIEALRGVAALTVVAHHSWSLSNMPMWSWTLPLGKLPGLSDHELPVYRLVEGFGLWGVMLFFMLSGYLLADTFWRTERADLRVYAIRRIFRIAPAYYVSVVLLFLFFAAHRQVFSEQGARQLAANATFTHYLFPNYSSSLNVNGAWWTLTIELLLYAFLPLMAVLVRFNPWIGTAILIAIGLGWRAWVAFDGDWLRTFYFGDNQFSLPIESLFIARQFFGAVAIFALGILARWLVVHGHLDSLYRALPARLGVSSFLVLMLPSLALLYWVEDGTQYTNRLLFTVYDFGLMVALLPALLLAARPQQFTASPLRSVSQWLGERSYSIYLWHFPIVLAIYERGPQRRMAPEDGYWWRLPLILFLTLVFATVSYHLIERPGMERGRQLAKRISTRRPNHRTSKEPVT